MVRLLRRPYRLAIRQRDTAGCLDDPVQRVVAVALWFWSLAVLRVCHVTGFVAIGNVGGAGVRAPDLSHFAETVVAVVGQARTRVGDTVNIAGILCRAPA